MTLLNCLVCGALICFCAALISILKSYTRSGEVVLLAGLVLYTLFLVFRAASQGPFLYNSLVASAFFIPLPAGLIVFGLRRARLPRKTLIGGFGLLAAVTVFALFYPRGIIFPTANKTGFWPFVFFLFEGSAYAFFALSGVLALFLSGSSRESEILRRMTALGFTCFSFAQVLGAVWSFLGWGHPFMWSPRHLASAAIWLSYAALVHLQYSGISMKTERWLGVAVSVLAMFLFYSHLIFEMGMPRLGAGL